MTITPQDQRKAQNKKQTEGGVTNDKDSQSMGVIQSINSKSIHPIYVKLKNNKLVKINIFDGIRPASLDDLPIIQDL